jgi:hypothetical protein
MATMGSSIGIQFGCVEGINGITVQQPSFQPVSLNTRQRMVNSLSVTFVQTWLMSEDSLFSTTEALFRRPITPTRILRLF